MRRGPDRRGETTALTVTVTVRLFALARDRAGRPVMALDFDGPTPVTVADVRRALADACPALAPIVPSLMFAVDQTYADDATAVEPGSEVAAIPPVSGGSGAFRR